MKAKLRLSVKGARVPQTLPPRVWPILPATDTTAKATLTASNHHHHPLIGQPLDMHGEVHDKSLFMIPWMKIVLTDRRCAFTNPGHCIWIGEYKTSTLTWH